MKKQNRSSKKTRSSLRVEALEQRQLLAGISGGGTEVLTDLVHSNGNVYDQVLMNGASVTVQADAGQVTRVSFLDLSGDIVQVEFSGAGSLQISLDAATYKGPAEAANYNQPGVQYVTGLASFTITGSDPSTHFSVWSVGTGTAFGGAASSLFSTGLTGGDHNADVQRLTIVADPANANGSTFGGIRMGNAEFVGDTGVVGISAANVQVQDVVRIGDISASGSATPTLVFGTNSQFGGVYVQGGDLVQANARPINNTGSYGFAVNMIAGSDSAGTSLPAQSSSLASGFTGSNPFASQTTTYTLTTGVDTVTGTANSDTINASNTTLTALDAIDGGAGTDTLNLLDTVGGFAIPAGVTVKNVENAVVRSAGATTLDTTGWTGLTSLQSTQSTAATLTAAKTTAVDVSGSTGAISVTGGSTVTIADATAGVTVNGSTNLTVGATGTGQAISIGATTVAGGPVAVTAADLAGGSIAVDGGTTVNVTASKATTGTISVGQGGAAADLPSGAVTVTSTSATQDGTGSVTLGAVAIDGGSSVTVTQTVSAASDVGTKSTGGTTTQSAISVDGGSATTSVTVSQSSAVTAVAAVPAVTGAKETVVVTFPAMAAGETVSVNGLTFTASKALTAAQVAAAFANLPKDAIVGSAPASNGVYTGTFNTIAGSTGAVTTASGVSSVTYTSDSSANIAALTIADTAAAGDVSVTATDGKAGSSATAGKLGVVGGVVTINGAITGTDVLATVSLTGYGAGSTVASDALTTLNLANSSKDVTVTNAAATSLNLGLNNVTSAAAVGLGGTYTSLTITGSGANSAANITAGGVTSLAVTGDKTITLTGSTLGALKTVTVGGSAGLTMDASGATVTSVDTSATTGTATITLDASKATYTGGAGTDAVTLSSTTVSKAVNTGAGNDTVTLAAGTTSLTEAIVAGDGSDTLVGAAADLATATATATFETKIDGFEKVSIGAAAADATVDLANLDDINYVISAGAAATKTIEIKNLTNAGTIELTTAAAGTVKATMADATGSADTLNVTIINTGTINVGTLEAAGVETIAITTTDSNSTTGGQNTVTVKDAALTTLTVSGNGGLALTLDANVTALTSLNGSAMLGALTATTNGTVAQTITGGSGADSLTAKGNGDVLVGGAGNDTLTLTGATAPGLVTLTGGAGNDVFNIGIATSNVNSYATITDLSAGDSIQFNAAAADFVAAKVTLGDTAVFQDYANEAIQTTDTGDVAWFQYNGNTYIVSNVSNGSSFVNGTDLIVKVSGLVDLSNSAFTGSSDRLVFTPTP